MHFARVFLSVLVLLAPARLQAGSEPLIRIACVGDSITFGLNIPDREKACYPVVLAARLGARYEVRNFGISGATLLKNGDYSYWLLPEYKAALDYAPTAVVILLGTNDSKLNNAVRRGDFEKDLNEMTDAFQSLPSQPKILLCTPPPLFGFLRSVQQAALEREGVDGAGARISPPASRPRRPPPRARSTRRRRARPAPPRRGSVAGRPRPPCGAA